MKFKQIYPIFLLTITCISPAMGQKDYPIDSLIQLLRTNNYQSALLPNLICEDIPELLEIANDPTIVTKFPRNPFSSSGLDSCYLGIVSLWLIETIRIGEQRGHPEVANNSPSLTAVLKEKNNKDWKHDLNSIIKMETAYQAYKTWWKTVGHLNKQAACNISPLENTNLTW